jgi:autotransporter translocation and assembly factor TamB
MKWLAITVAIASLMACSGGSGVGNPTAPTTLVTNANVSGPSAEVSGSYNGTITASSTCSANLPPEARVLGFTATIAQTAAALQVQLSSGGNTVTVSGTVSGQTVNFPSFSFSGTGRGASVTLVATGGNANVAADGSIAGTLSGTYQTSSGFCNATNHQLQMVKPKPPSPRP